MKYFIAIIFIVFSVTYFSCNNKVVNVKNQSTKTFDSVLVFVNEKKVQKLINFKEGFSFSINYSSDSIKVYRDVRIFIGLYNQGKKINDYFHYDDLTTIIPSRINVTISDSLKLKVKLYYF